MNSADPSKRFLPPGFQILTPLPVAPANQAAVGSPNQSAADGVSFYTETAVWNLVDPTTLEIHPQWINTDGSKPTTYLVYYTTLHYFAVTGDPAALAAEFPENNDGANIVVVSPFHNFREMAD